MAKYNGNKTVAVILSARGTTYQAGVGASAAAALTFSVTDGGQRGAFTGRRITATGAKTYVSVKADWSCPSILAPPAS